MNRENAKALLPIIEGYAEGKVVQVDTGRGNWRDVDSPSFGSLAKRYRLKPEPRTFYLIEVKRRDNDVWNIWWSGFDVRTFEGQKKAAENATKGQLFGEYRALELVEKL